MTERIDERLQAMGVDTSGMTDEQKFTAATGLTRYAEYEANNPWYVPGGAANVIDGTNEPAGPTGGNTSTTEPAGPTGGNTSTTEPAGPTGGNTSTTEPEGTGNTDIQPIGEPTTAYGVSATMPTAATIKSIVDINATKPEESVQIDMTNSTASPGAVQYFVYPLAWEESSDGEITNPVIKDPNGFSVGFFADDDNPTLEVDGITYRICDIELGKMIYTVTFVKSSTATIETP